MTKKMSAFPSCPCPSSTHCGAIGRNLGRVPLCRRGRGRARAIGCLGVGRREGEKWLEPIVVARARSRSPALGARVHARDRAPEIARGRVFDLPHAPGNHLLLAHSLHRHGALDCCRSGVGGTAVSPRPRVAREARDIERASRFGRLRSPSSRSRRADEIVGFTEAMVSTCTYREARRGGRRSCARPPWRGRRRRSWRRRWRPFLLLCGVRKAGSVCEYDPWPALSDGFAGWRIVLLAAL